jgi:aminopeptidase N
MLAWAAGPYRPLELGTTAAGTHLVGYYLDDENGGSANLASGAVNVVTAFDWLEQRYGAYAFGSEAGPVAVRWQDSAFDGMEHHPFWHVRESESFDQLTELHELAHGWFGDGVRIRCWEDFVLSEGLASYLAARLSNELGAFPVDMWSEYEVVLSQGLATDASVAWPEGCNQIDVLTSGLDSNMTYVKGALFLRELEKRVGTDAFDAALAYFYERWVGKAAGVQDLLDAVEHSSGYHAEECANHWLRTLSPREQACP